MSMGPGGYATVPADGGLSRFVPAPDPTRDQALAERHWKAYRFPPLVPEDTTKVTPLDVR